jgi:hypothetical protein
LTLIRDFRESVLSSFRQDGQQRVAEFNQDDLVKVKHVTKMLSELGTYQEIFEAPFLERTGAFFAAKSKQLLDAKIPLPDYL